MIKKVFNAGIYPRVSTMRQVREGFSLEAQRKNLTYFVENQGWKVCGDYGDEGISGKNVKDRPGVKRLIADIKSGKIDAVVLYKFDRLTRDSRDTEDFIELIQEYNIAVYALSGGLVDVSTPSGRFNTRILGAAAQFERETTIDRVIDGFIGKVKKGFTLCSSTCSYGYDRPKHQEVQTINEKEAVVVKRIFNLYLHGKTFTEIADMLNSENIRPKNYGLVRKKRNSDEYYTVKSVFQPKTIRMILSNENYVGNVRYGINREQVTLEEANEYSNRKKGFIAPGVHEPIIDKKTFEQVAEKLKKIKSTHKKNDFRDQTYFLGTLECGFCGHVLTTNRTNKIKKDGTRHVFLGYRCINREKHLCQAIGMSQEKVEKVFLDYMDKIADFENVDKIDYSEEQMDTSILNALKKQLLQKTNKLKEIMDLFMDDKLNYTEYQEMKGSLEDTIEKLKRDVKREEKRIEPKKDLIDKTKIAKSIKEHWLNLTKDEKKDFLNEFVEKIIIVNKSKDKAKGMPEILDVKFYED